MIWKIAASNSNNISSTDALIKTLLDNRSIKDEDQDLFFYPDLSLFESNLQIPGIDLAKKRVNEAIKNKELIYVYGDYDVDGICATAIIYNALSSLGANVLPYIPHREKEGYGLSTMGLDIAKEKGSTLVITVDNGIVAIEQAKYAKSLGIDLIITDHHVPLEDKPEALSIIHSTEIGGAAVAWAFARQLISKEESTYMLDLVAVATICDLIPLFGVNRALVKSGLEVLNNTSRVGFLSLFEESGVERGKIGTYEIGHILGPRLNALGRIENAMDALRLLCTNNKANARSLAKTLSQANEYKKKLTTEAIVEAKKMVNDNFTDYEKNKILILESEKWIPGVIGLVAGRIAEEYKMPTIAMSMVGDLSKASARTVDGVNIIESIRECSEFLLDVGGHPKAAGFTLKKENIHFFKEKIYQVMSTKEYSREGYLNVDIIVDVNSINWDWIDILDRFEPFGVDNPKPVFASLGVDINSVRILGKNGDHLKFQVGNIDAIAFGMGNLASLIEKNHKADIAFTPEVNRFNGRESMQLKIYDIKLQ